MSARRPAPELVSRFLETRGIVVEKTGNYTRRMVTIPGV
jgi:hypothetical protein